MKKFSRNMVVEICLTKWRKDSVTLAVPVLEHILCAFKAWVVGHGLQATALCNRVVRVAGLGGLPGVAWLACMVDNFVVKADDPGVSQTR